MKLEDLLRMTVDRNASDLHLVAGIPPILRIDGKVTRTDLPMLTAKETENYAREFLTGDRHGDFEKARDYDSSFNLSGVARFRLNFHYQRSSPAIAIRVVPYNIPNFDSLGVPRIVLETVEHARGLFLVTGATGSGKSTTLAAVIDHINKNQELRVITIEDPIEFMHSHSKSIIEQREVGIDTRNFLSGLKYALRQDPDVILVGEMRDYETIAIAVTAAETGHLVLATLHTLDAVSTVDRIVDIFPSDQQLQVRSQLAESLIGTCSQMLLPRQGGGRVVATEVLISNPAVRNLVREGETSKIFSQIEIGSRYGMATFDQAIIRLYNEGQISMDTAIRYARDKEHVKQKLFGE